MVLKILLLVAAIIAAAAFVVLFVKQKITKKTMLMAVTSILAVSVIVVLVFTVFVETTITVNDDKNITLDVFGTYTEAGYKARSGLRDVSDAVMVNGSVDVSKVGEYRIEYIYRQGNKEYKAVRVVNVVDKSSPTLTLTGDTNLTLSKIDLFKEPGFTATDNYDGDIAANVKVEKNKINDTKYEIVYTATDSSGNSATAKREVQIKDIVPPVISLKGNRTYYVVENTKYNESGYTATDDADGDISGAVNVKGSVNTAVRGTYNITYSVKDSAGNTATVTRQVIVCSKDDAAFNKVCLTFDDGPSSAVTVQILDTLKQYGVQATFFICNYSEDKIPILKRMINEGHAIGIHGYSHDYATIYKTDDAFMQNINKLRDKLYKDTGYYTTLMRFPGGGSNTVSKNPNGANNKGAMTRLTQRVQQEGWQYFDWNVSSGDAEPGGATADEIYRNVTNGLGRKRTNVVLMHDINSKKTTAEALPRIISYAQQAGYSFAAIDKDTPGCHHPVLN